MARRGARRITVIGVGTPPPLTPLTLRPLAMEIVHGWEAKQVAEREVKERREDRGGREHKSGPEAPRAR
jgi:hypothetical protein